MTTTETPERTAVRNQLICAWCGPIFAVLFTIGFVALARFIPAPSPSDSAEATAALFQTRGTAIKIGLIICQVAIGLWLPWGVAVASRVRMIEGRPVPTLTYVQLGAVAIVTAQIEITTVVWEIGAFRAGQAPPWVTQLLNDTGWFLFLFLFVPLTIWVLSLAPPVLQDRSANPDFPRWVGYLSLWVGLLLLPGAPLVFFKSGVWAWNGLLPLYIPLTAFFVWFFAVAFYTIRALDRELAQSRSGA
jgi:hypothetical protein